MSDWQELDMEAKIRAILHDFQIDEPDHWGTVFVSSYQIAIALDEETRLALDKPIGGSGTGQHDSIAKYIANQLSRRIKSGEITDIEGGWLARENIKDIQFNDGQRDFSPTGGNKNVILSMFRLVP